MNIREMLEQATQLERLIADGEGTDKLETALSVITENLPSKVDSLQFVLERIKAQAKYWSDQAEAYEKVAQSCEKATDRLKQYIKDSMIKTYNEEILGNDWRAKLVKVKAALNIDENQLPDEYRIVQTKMIPDKERIRQDLELGHEIEGCRLVDAYSLRFYPNKKL